MASRSEEIAAHEKAFSCYWETVENRSGHVWSDGLEMH